MNELETAVLSSDDHDLSLYLENIDLDDFRAQVREIINKHQNPDLKAIKARLIAALETL